MIVKWTAAAVAAFVLSATFSAAAQEAPPQFQPPVVEPSPGVKDPTAYARNPLTYTDAQGHSVHVKPTAEVERRIHSILTPAAQLVTYGGGSIMQTAQIYNIFWAPPKLQNGTAAVMTAHYEAVTNSMSADYVGHTISSNNTQYYQKVSTIVTDISGLTTLPGGSAGSFGGSYVDVNPFPASQCTDTATPGNCVTDAQMQTEIKRVMKLKGWTGGLNKIYMMYTAKGEGSCFAGTGCAYTDYCGYHGNIGLNSSAIIYVNMPYGDPGCSNGKSPNNDPDADSAADTATHEISESITDPVNGTGWTDASGNEIGDKCNTSYGAFNYDGGKANQYWNGHYWDTQEEWDNHTGACAQVGP